MPTIPEMLALLTNQDYEEAALLHSWNNAVKDRRDFLADGKNFTTLSSSELEKRMKAIDTRIQELKSRLGYDLESTMRPKKATGRPRGKSIPDPLPAVGTKLRSCLGEIYIVAGYLKMPRSTFRDMIVYDRAKADGEIVETGIVRNVSHLLTGMMTGTNEPLVAWPDDPRGFKPNTEVPLSKRRTMTPGEQAANRRELDPDARPLNRPMPGARRD